MFGILQNFKEEQGFRMDRWVRDGVLATERVYGPLLINPNKGEKLILYLSMSPTAVSAVLIKEEDKL